MWIDINEAVTILKTSRRTLDRQVAAKTIESKKSGKQRLIWIDDDSAVNSSPTSPAGSQFDRQIKELKTQLEQLNEDNRQLAASNCQLAAKIEKMSDDAVEASKRHDVIVMRLADQIEAQRLQLEETQRPRPLLDRLKAVFIPLTPRSKNMNV